MVHLATIRGRQIWLKRTSNMSLEDRDVETSTVAAASAGIPAFNRAITNADLTITPAAREKMAELFSEVEDDINAIRVFVTGGGCNGMSYGMTFTDQVHDTDCVRDEDGFSLYVDAVAMSFLQGVEIDFVDRGTTVFRIEIHVVCAHVNKGGIEHPDDFG